MDGKQILDVSGHIGPIIHMDEHGRIILTCPRCDQEWHSSVEALIKRLQAMKLARDATAYMDASLSPEVQGVIQDMAKIANDPKATDDERHAAVATIADALCRLEEGERQCLLDGDWGAICGDGQKVAQDWMAAADKVRKQLHIQR